MSDAPTLVTGATGFVGAAVARVLLARGHALRLLVRPGGDRRNIAGLQADLAEGDLTDAASLARAADGCRYLVHVAADYRLWVPDPEAMMRANVAGSRNLLLAAQSRGVERMVYCSSVAALGLVGDGSVADETTPVHPDKIVGVYKRSKYLAEQAVLALVAEQAMPVVIVNPSTPVGPRDIKPTPTGRMIRDAAAGRMPAYVDTGLNVVHVDDVAEGHALALERGVVGERYILGGEDFALGDLFALVARVAGRRPPRMRLPIGPLLPVALVCEALARFGMEPVVTRETLAMARKKMFFSSDKARAALGYAPRPAIRAIEDAVAWFPRRRMIWLAALSLAIWVYLLAGHGRFWQAGPFLPPAAGGPAPAVTVVVPARNEAESIFASLRSLLAQDYAGELRVVLVDDLSTDGTGGIANGIRDPRLTIIRGAPHPPGWSGKLWALQQGIAAAGGAAILLLTDADIEHAPGHLASLVAKLEGAPPVEQRLDMVSEMVALRCHDLAERALVPAFVFFFQLLYPFDWVNDPGNPMAAAAGGTVLIRAEALARAGGLAAMRGALIDDVTLARRVKQFGRIWLGHSRMAVSLRPYETAGDVWRMVARCAFVQLGYSPRLLAGTVAGLMLVWLVPPLAALLGHGTVRLLGLLGWAGMIAAYLPTLRRFAQNPVWAAALPGVAVFYGAATLGSALDHYRGRGVIWKQRAYHG